MDPLRNPAAFAPPPKRSGGCLGRGCAGCSMGCGLFLLLLLVGLGIGYHWMMSKSDVTPAQSMIGAQDRDFMIGHFDTADPGVTAVLSHIVDYARRTAPNAPPPSANPAQDQADQSRALATFLPRVELAIKLRPKDKGTEYDNVFFFCIPYEHLLSALFGMVRGQAVHDSIPYRDMTIEKFTSTVNKQSVDTYLCIYQGNVLMSQSLPLMKDSIDRLVSPSGLFGGPPDIKKFYDAVDNTRPIVGVESHVATIRDTLASLQGDNSLFPLTAAQMDYLSQHNAHMAYSLDLVTANDIAFKVLFDGADGAAAARTRAIVQKQGSAQEKAGTLKDLVIKQDGNEVLVTFKATGMESRMDQFFKNAKQAEGSSTPHPDN